MARILLVDDDPDQLDVRSLILQKAGHQVETARNVEAALAAFERTPVEVVLMDLRLPGAADGRRLLRTLRSRRPSVKIFVLSGSPEGLSALPESGLADEFLRKPVRSAHLLDLIARIA